MNDLIDATVGDFAAVVADVSLRMTTFFLSNLADLY